MVSMSALRLEGWGLIPGWVIPKVIKMGPNASPQHQGLDWKDALEPKKV